MHVQTLLPQHPTLREHIDFYYFFTSPNPDFDTTYLSFPNLYTPLNIHRNVETSIGPYSTSVYEKSGNGYRTIIQGMREYPLRVRLKGRIDKCTIAFKPLGINHFIDKNFIDIAPLDSQLFTHWDNSPYYVEFLQSFYATDDRHQRVQHLESFLLALYHPLEATARLQRSIRALADFDQRTSMADIAADAGLHLRSFNREFRKHLGISPVGFRKIARFRHSLTNGLFNPERQRLTDLAYASDFYDQSYFISMYKKMTGSNPKKLFREIESVGDDRILFQFVKK